MSTSPATSAAAPGGAARRDTYTGVQILRFVAAALVVCTHATLYTGERLDPALQVWHFGEIGVPLFFTISGFVMVVSSQRLVGHPQGWQVFGLRRVIRIVPMYWLATTVKLVTLVAVPGVVLHAAFDPGKTVLSYLFLPSRNVDGDIQPLLAVGWTLIFEMFFYLVFSIGLLLRVNRAVFASVVLVLVAGVWVVRPVPWPPFTIWFDPLVLYFLVGIVIGALATGSSRWRCSLSLVAVLGYWWLLVAHAPYPLPLSDVRALPKALLVTAVVLGAVLVEARLRRAESLDGAAMARPRVGLVALTAPVLGLLVFLGDASYSLYLFHPLVAPVVPTALRHLGLDVVPLSLVLCVVAACVAASVLYVVVERPLTRWLQRRVTDRYRVAPKAAVPAAEQ